MFSIYGFILQYSIYLFIVSRIVRVKKVVIPELLMRLIIGLDKHKIYSVYKTHLDVLLMIRYITFLFI